MKTDIDQLFIDNIWLSHSSLVDFKTYFKLTLFIFQFLNHFFLRNKPNFVDH
jgi:hypothetical protein